MRTRQKTFSLALAMTHQGGIGKNNQLPWKLPTDLKHFKDVTTQGDSKNVVIMGRRTWDSIQQKPLKQRDNVVISRTLKPSQNSVSIFPSLNEALNFYENSNQKLFVIGGKQLFEESMQSDKCNDIHLTRVGIDVPCDVYVDTKYLSNFKVTKVSKTLSENNINFDFQHLVRNTPNDDSKITTKHEELQYLDLIRTILKNGTTKDDRTGTGTYSLFGQTMRYSLDSSFPLLTTKQVFFRGVVEELLWFIRGETDGHTLLDKKVKIWEGNGTREYFDSIGITRDEHDLGPIYGFQWRHFGANYSDSKQCYTGQGIDQLQNVIHLLKTNPSSRRIIMSAWNPVDLPQMALPPCHVMSQFNVSNGKLSCMMYQRSCDVGLGVPFNIASYALLTCILADLCNLERGELVHVMGDTHLYQNHKQQVEKQLDRVPYPFPLLRIAKRERIEDYQVEDFQLSGYRCHDKIKMKMAV